MAVSLLVVLGARRSPLKIGAHITSLLDDIACITLTGFIPVDVGFLVDLFHRVRLPHPFGISGHLRIFTACLSPNAGVGSTIRHVFAALAPKT